MPSPGINIWTVNKAVFMEGLVGFASDRPYDGGAGLGLRFKYQAFFNCGVSKNKTPNAEGKRDKCIARSTILGLP
jgi:hypothetical protein